MTTIPPQMKQAPILRDKAGPSRVFLLFAPLIFAAYALLTPPFQTFDENQHLYRAWQISSLTLTGERRGSQSGGELPPGLATATLKEIGSVVPQGERKVVVRPFSQIFSWNTPIGLNRSPIYYNFFGAVLYSPVSYLPQSIAVRIGKAIGISVEWTLRLGRLLNCAVCIGLIWWALTLIPFGQWTMLTIALLPPAAAGAASFGQDGLVIGAGFLLTAFGLKVATERRWSAASVVAVSVAGVAVTVSKFVYLPLVAIAALPKPSGILWRRWLAAPVLSGLVAALLLFVWMRVNAHTIVTFRPWLPPVSEQVAWMVTHPLAFCVLVARTYAFLLPFMWAGLYAFGDSTVPIVSTAALAGTAAVLAVMVYGEDREVDLSAWRRTWMLLIFVTVAMLIATALFIASASPGALYIPGIQARYFLPMLPLAAISLMRRGEQGPPVLAPVTSALVLVAHVMTLGTIVLTFYSF